MKKFSLAIMAAALVGVLVAAACTNEVVKEVPFTVEVERVVEKEVVKEVAVEKVVTVEVEVVRDVVREVEVEKQVVRVVEVDKIVEVEKELTGSLAAEAAKYGGTLRIVPSGSLTSPDPQWTSLLVTAHVKRHVYEGLFQPDAEFNAQPMLVDTWNVSDDGLVWRFTLREGLKFHDGRPVTTNDVVGSFNRVKDVAFLWRMFRNTFGATMTADGNDVVVRLTEPTGPIFDALATEQGASPVIVPEEQWSLPQTESSQTAIGTGPYRFVSWEPGDRWIAERWDDYMVRPEPASGLAGNHTAYLNRIEWIEIPDMASRVSALTIGQVDVLDEFKADFVSQLKSDASVNVFVNKPGNSAYVFLNQARLPFSDIRARRAVQLAYPSVEALTVAVGDPEFWSLCPILFACDTKYDSGLARANAAQYYNQRDVEAARQLVRDAGLEGYKVRVMQALDTAVVAELASVTAEVFAEIGFDVDLQAMDWATQGTRRTDPDLWEAFHSWSSTYRLTSPILVSWIQKEGWVNQYQDETGRMTELYEQFVRARTWDEQKPLIEQINTFVFEDVAAVQIGEFYPPIASRTDVWGFNPIPFLVVWGTWLER